MTIGSACVALSAEAMVTSDGVQEGQCRLGMRGHEICDVAADEDKVYIRTWADASLMEEQSLIPLQGHTTGVERRHNGLPSNRPRTAPSQATKLDKIGKVFVEARIACNRAKSTTALSAAYAREYQ